MSPILYIIIPCYNEEEVLPLTSGMFLEELEQGQDMADHLRPGP